jgi:hypothetical protein
MPPPYCAASKPVVGQKTGHRNAKTKCQRVCCVLVCPSHQVTWHSWDLVAFQPCLHSFLASTPSFDFDFIRAPVCVQLVLGPDLMIGFAVHPLSFGAAK